MNRPEYSDIYKFVASIGILLLGAAVLVPWLILREPIDANLTVGKLEKLPTEVQDLIAIRHATQLWFLNKVGWISAITAVCGFGMLGWGVWRWSKNQQVIDEKGRIELEQARRNLQNARAENITDKALQEAEETTPLVTGREREASVAPKIDLRDAVRAVFEVESEVGSRLHHCFSDYRLLTRQVLRAHRKQSQHHPIDVIIPTPSEYPDIIFEIKYSTTFDRGRLQGALSQLALTVREYVLATNKPASGILIFVYEHADEAEINVTEFERFADSMQRPPNEYLGVLITPRANIDNLPCGHLRYLGFRTDD